MRNLHLRISRLVAVVGGFAVSASLVAAPAPASVPDDTEPSLANAANRFTEPDEPTIIALQARDWYFD